MVLKEKNTSLIDMQSNSMAEVQTRYEYMQLTLHDGRFVFHACMHACKAQRHACMCQARSGCFAKGVCRCYKSRLRDESVPGPCKVMASNFRYTIRTHHAHCPE